MFYSDFLHFKKYGISISGLRYQAIEFGPVPVHYRTIYDNIDGLEQIISLVSDHKSSNSKVTDMILVYSANLRGQF